MKKKIINKEATYLRRKLELYESFLFRYLPRITSLSYVTRLNIYDAFGRFGTDRSGSQGSPALLFEALRKQRQHQLRKRLPLKPVSLTLLHPPEQVKTYRNALEYLQVNNAASNTCKLDSWAVPFNQGAGKVSRQSQQQPASEKHLLMLDPLGLPQFLFQDVPNLAEKKVDIIICLPLSQLWQLHAKPEKTIPSAEVAELKGLLDQLFPADHPYWSPEPEAAAYMDYLKQAFSKDDKLFTALEPAGTEVPETALLAISTDAFMMEKMLMALQELRPAAATPPGQQLDIFGLARPTENQSGFGEEVLALLPEERDNQQLYVKGLKAGLLPAQLMDGLLQLLQEGKLEIKDDRNKPLTTTPPNCLSYTAFKAAKPVCFFSLKEVI